MKSHRNNPDAQVSRTEVHHYNHWSRPKSLAVLSALTLSVVLGQHIFKKGGNIVPDASDTIAPAEVFKITPIDLDCRAIVKSRIAVDAVIEKGPSWASSKFRGPSGKGGGQVNTLVCVEASNVEVDIEKRGKKNIQNISIPTSSVRYFSAVDENKSTVIREDGKLYNVGELLFDLAGSETASVGHGALDSYARAAAVNEALTNCGPSAWETTHKAITEAYLKIGAAQYREARARGEDISREYEPKDISVNFTGPDPEFNTEYEIPEGVDIHNSKLDCTVIKDAF